MTTLNKVIEKEIQALKTLAQNPTKIFNKRYADCIVIIRDLYINENISDQAKENYLGRLREIHKIAREK